MGQMNLPLSLFLPIYLILISGCHRAPPPEIDWTDHAVNPAHFPYEIDDRIPCWLKLNRAQRPVIRVNCFAIEGSLHTHSNRFVATANLFGSSWTVSAVEQPNILVAIKDEIFAVTARRVHSEDWRVHVLQNRGYWYIPDAIQVFELVPITE